MAERVRPLIKIENLHKRFGRRAVLRGVDLKVPAGRSMAILGNNGAGKTTLVRLIAGLAKPEKGGIQLGGAEFKHAGYELRRYIGLVGHVPYLYSHLTAAENLHFFAVLYDLAEPQGRIDSLLHAVNLWTRRNDPVRTYSRGMMQRLAIARAVLHDPPVLLLDEPDTGLDQASTQLLQGMIQQLSSKQRAILFTTHNLDNALRWSDEFSLLSGGRIVTQGNSEEMTVESLRALYREKAEER